MLTSGYLVPVDSSGRERGMADERGLGVGVIAGGLTQC